MERNIDPNTEFAFITFEALEVGMYWFALQTARDGRKVPMDIGSGVVSKVFVNPERRPVIHLRRSAAEVAKIIDSRPGGSTNIINGRIQRISLRPRTLDAFADVDFLVFRDVEFLSLSGNNVTYSFLCQLAAMPSSLRFLIMESIDAPLIDEGVIELLRKQPALNAVIFTDVSITDKSLVEIGKLKRLFKLDLSGTKVSDKGLRHLAKLRLNSLHLSRTGISDAALQHLGIMTDLDNLGLDETKVTDKGLRNLAPLKLMNLSLGKTAITDAGLRELKGMKTLRYLDLEGTKISDLGMQDLSEISSLRWLKLGSTDVSKRAKQALQNAIPELRIIEAEAKQ